MNIEALTADRETKVKVYGDNKLIYTSPIITGGVHPIDFNVDLTGVLELKIEFAPTPSYGLSGNDSIIVDAGLYQ